jgi:threonine aldolase
MVYFECDYNRGTHEKILERLVQTNREAHSGYGADKYCASAKEKIKEACGGDVDVHFLVGGTQTNQIVISSMLRTYEGAIAAATGHIGVHEAGAIEYSGHKVLPLPQKMGKLDAADVEAYLRDFYADANYEHTVIPGMVYISHPTEYGTLYTLSELEALAAVCAEYKIPLYMDGARLGYGLASEGTDVTLRDIARLCDVFYIGGTKVGALFGEAVVFTKNNAPKHFMTITKQHGALLAKGRLLGIQFDTLFTDGLYMEISRHAIEMADKLRKILRDKGYEFFIETVTNQIFVVLDNDKMNELKKSVKFDYWEKKDENHTVVRFATAWSTEEDEIDELARLI